MTAPRVVDRYELSPTQEGMLFHGLQGETTGVDVEQIVCSVDGPFDGDAFVAAFHRVAARHEILRTRFSYDETGRPRQEVLEAVEIPVARLDLGSLEPADRERQFEETLRVDRARGVDLGHAPAMRLLLVASGGAEHRVVWTFHHALLDGRSFPLILREVFALAGGAAEPALPRPYREYIERLRGLDLVAAETYFRERLRGFGAPTPLVIDRGEPDDSRTRDVQGVAERRLSRAATNALASFAAERGASLNTLLQAAWAIVLHRYSRETDLVFGATRACRRSAFPDADGMVGLFINTLPMRVEVTPEKTLGALLAEVRARQAEVRPHEHTPLVKVQGWSQVPRGRPLFETIVVYENRTLDATLRGSLDAGPARVGFSYRGQTNFPLTLIAYGDDEMLVRLENDRRRVDDAPAARMLGHLLTLLAAMPGRADRPIRELPILTDEERASLVPSAAGPTFPSDVCLHQRFEAQARRVPDRVAAICDGAELTYAELDRRANALAWKLRELGVGPDALVGIRTERTLDIVVGILGILKAGGAYLPLDPAYPKDRVEFMLKDSAVAVVVTSKERAADFEGGEAALVLVDGDLGEAASAPESGVKPENLAYVIYTSGSTGRPKGVLITHANVNRLFDATDDWFHFDENDVWTLFHSYAFDFSVWELWGALFYGGRVVVVPYWVSRAPESFRELLLREGVTVLNQTPSAFRQLIQADVLSGPTVRTRLRYVIFGGEALDLASLRPWYERHGDAEPRLVNMYGITETTVHVTYRPLAARDLDARAGSVIGAPIPDLRIVLLDPDGAPVPIGVPGEIHVGGAGLSRGYLGRPELTAQRFIADPFSGGGARLYRSGDLARRLADGDVEYLGRIDAQVKIRGFRIELGEIEAVLGQHPDVSEAVVVVREDTPSDKRLVAYLVGAGEPGALVERLKTHLRASLPEYMVPPHIVVLPRLPLTPNGKVDRKALPAPDLGHRDRAKPFVAPRTPIESTLAKAWATVLGVPRVGIDDNFFELGGDSILTIQLIATCRQAGLRFTPRDLARRPTIGQLAEVVEAAVKPAAEVAAVEGAVAPTPIVRWFLERRFADPNHWNQAFLFEVPATLDVAALETALGHVVAHHDALRLRVSGAGLVHDAAAAPVRISRVDLSGVAEKTAAIEAAATDAEARFDIARGPVLAAVHFDLGASARFLLAAHHLVVDGVSWRLLVEDLEAAYTAVKSGSPVALPPRTASFQRWSEELVRYAGSAAPGASLARWQAICAVDGKLPDSSAGPDPEGLARTLTVALDPDETQALLQRVHSAYRTEINDVLLAALALAVRGAGGRDALRIDVEGHGREEWVGSVDLSRTVGWFTTLYPVALDLAGADDERAALVRVKETLRRVPDRGLSYGVLRYLTGALAAPPPAELLFNYLGQFDRVVSGSRLFAFADEPTGPWHGPKNERTHRFEVVAMVRRGRFEARWIYGAERERPEAVARLAEAFIAALRSLVRHCLAVDAPRGTPSDFPLAELDQPSLDRLLALHPDLEDVYPLSPMQRLFLSMESSQGGAASIGFEQWLFRLRGPVDAAALRAAWESTLAAHAMLRTAFVGDAQPRPLQVVKRRVALPWAEVDLRGDATRLDELMRADRDRGFDVATAPLCRLTLVRVSDDEHRLLWSTHHLYVDGWSWPLVFRDVGAAYAARLAGRDPALSASCQYGAYIGWLGGSAPDSQSFWKERLAGFAAPTPLPFDAEPGATSDGEATLDLPADPTAALQALARARQITQSTVVQTAWAMLLGRLAGHDDVVFGAAFSGRPAELPGVESLVGPCVNNLPVRVRLDGDETAAAALGRLQADNAEVAHHQYASLPDIQRWAGIPWRLRIFDTLVVFQNYLVGDEVRRWGEATVEPLVAPDATNYPLTLTVTPGAELSLKLAARGGRFEAATLSRMLDGLATLLTSLAENPEARVREIQSVLPRATPGRPEAARPRASYVVPGSEMERKVAEVWQALFEVDRVGVDDNFFDLGGHSMLLLQAHERIREATGNDLPIVALLQFPTVRALARYLSEGATTGKAGGVSAADRARLQRQALARQRDLRGKR